MAARTVSERHPPRNSRPMWPRSSHPTSESISFPLQKTSDKRRAEKHSAFERHSSPVTSQLRSRANTTSTDMHISTRNSSVHSAPNPALSSSLIASSASSHITPNSSVHASRAHNFRCNLSRKYVASSQPGSKNDDSDVIDLTLEDTEDELSISTMLLSTRTKHNHHHPDSSPSHRPFSSAASPPIAPERSLFTPSPPPKRRTRLFVAVPPFPKGVSKAYYRPISYDLPTPSLRPPPTSTLPPSQPPVAEEHTPAQTHKGKEREHSVVSPPGQPPPADEVDVESSATSDASYEDIPLEDDEAYPPLTTSDLVNNTRFYFAEAWREQATKLREAEFDWMRKYKLHTRPAIWGHSGNEPSPRVPRTASLVPTGRLRPWVLVPPEGSPQENAAGHALDEHAHATVNDAANLDDSDCMLLLPDDNLPGPSTTSGPAPSRSTESITDTEHDMNQYFNGLGGSPVAPSRQQPALAHTFRPHPLQSGGHSQMNSLGLELPSMELDPRMTDSGDRECFLGVPPSPPPQSSTVSDPIPDPPFESANYFPPSPTNIFEGSSAAQGNWPFEQGEGLLPVNAPSSNGSVAPSISATINPSLLGVEQSEPPSCPPKPTTQKRRSKLPEPVIYIRRPTDSSSLPLLPGKRSVQIKYRDSRGSSATCLTQPGTNDATSSHDTISIERTGDHTDDALRTKRRSVPSRKLLESNDASDSDSNCLPEPSSSRIILKIRKPTLRDLVSVTERQPKDFQAIPTMSYCHQCRNKSVRPKMSCSNALQGRVCGKRFCNRCILYRYPDVTFDEHSASFLCPVCTNTCNCSFCSRNRGEEFVSMRLGGLATSLFTAKITLVRDGDQPHSRPKSLSNTVDARRSANPAATTPTPEPSEMPSQPQFWAHVYGMEGERVGRAFMTRDQMEHLRAGGPVLPQPPSSQPRKKAHKPSKRYNAKDKPKGPRVFIGRPLAGWRIRAVRDLEPIIDAESETPRDKDKGESSAAGRGSSASSDPNRRRRRRRCYIGNPLPLYEPYQRMPGTVNVSSPPTRCSTAAALHSDGRLTPLSNLAADNWPQPARGEFCTWEPPGMVAPGGPSGSFVADAPGLGAPASAGGMLPIVDSLQDTHIGDNAMDVDVVGGEASASMTLDIPQEDMHRAIRAALAAIGAQPTC